MDNTLFFILLSLISRKSVLALQCHICSGETCGIIVLQPELTSKCDIQKETGKCFIRKDPNQVTYWGCIDDEFWPGVPWRQFNGCREDWDRSWEHEGTRYPMIWCFCDFDDCNVSIEQLNKTVARTTFPPTLSAPTTALNPCMIFNGGCDQLCIVNEESFRCGCGKGYTLDTDGKSCNDRDECGRSNGRCSHECINTVGSYNCKCPTGYRLDTDNLHCSDIDECRGEDFLCEQTCLNTPGSYQCSCNRSNLFQLAEDQVSCQARCPNGFYLFQNLSACYRVISQRDMARSQSDAEKECQAFHKQAHLVSMENTIKRKVVNEMLQTEPEFLEGWQGWWTGAKYNNIWNTFLWTSTRDWIRENDPHWGFKRTPFRDTCIWIMQIQGYNHTWGNYDCNNKAGYVCEIQISEVRSHLMPQFA